MYNRALIGLCYGASGAVLDLCCIGAGSVLDRGEWWATATVRSQTGDGWTRSNIDFSTVRDMNTSTRRPKTRKGLLGL